MKGVVTMRNSRKRLEFQEAVTRAKAHEAALEHRLSETDPMFLLFARYFLQSLSNESNAEQIVQAWDTVTSHLYYLIFHRVTPEGLPRVLMFLSGRHKRILYRRFPELVRAIFPEEMAECCIEEFEGWNRTMTREIRRVKRELKQRA